MTARPHDIAVGPQGGNLLHAELQALERRPPHVRNLALVPLFLQLQEPGLMLHRRHVVVAARRRPLERIVLFHDDHARLHGRLVLALDSVQLALQLLHKTLLLAPPVLYGGAGKLFHLLLCCLEILLWWGGKIGRGVLGCVSELITRVSVSVLADRLLTILAYSSVFSCSG